MATAPKSDLPTKLANRNKAAWIKLAQNYKAKHGTLKGFTDKYGFGYWPNKDGNFTIYMPDTDSSIKGGIKPKSYYGRLSQKLKDRIKRDNSALLQLFGENTFPESKGGLDVHHRRKISQYALFFEGATLEEARELARYAAEDLNSPLGHTRENAKFVDKETHTKHHKWERKNNFTRQGFPELTKDGPFPSDFTNADLETRKYALNRFLANEQPKIDANLEALQKASNNPLARIANTVRQQPTVGQVKPGNSGLTALANTVRGQPAISQKALTGIGKASGILTAVAFADAIGRGASANELGGMAIDSVNPIDGGAIADGTLQGQKYREMRARPKEHFPTTQSNASY